MCFTTAIPFRYSNRGFFFWDLQASVCRCAVLCCSFAGMLWRFHLCCQKLSWVGMHVCCLNWRCFSCLHILFLPNLIWWAFTGSESGKAIRIGTIRSPTTVIQKQLQSYVESSGWLCSAGSWPPLSCWGTHCCLVCPAFLLHEGVHCNLWVRVSFEANHGCLSVN